MTKLLSYTREVVSEDIYSAKLAYSMHLAIVEDGVATPLNHNSGVLFVKATENEDGSLNARVLDKPYLIYDDENYYVVGIRMNVPGDESASESVPCSFASKDLVHYREVDITTVESEKVKAKFNEYSAGRFEDEDITLKELPEGAIPVNMVEIPDEDAIYLRNKLMTPVNEGVILPEVIEAGCENCIKKVKATFVYSDGTRHDKKVDWDISSVDFTKAGEYVVKGTVSQPHFEFPIAINRADPCLGYWNNKYYFIATNDADGNHTLYIREADTIEGLVSAKEHLILDSTTYEDIGNLLWAPEFHILNGKLYIFHAATKEPFFSEESHIMELKEGGNPINKEDWTRPERVKKADGSDICEAGKVITLDMTCFEWEDECYAVWSERQFLPKDLGAWLMIAKINKDNPRFLKSEPVVLSKPEYGWANNHTFVDEGPFALIRDEKLFLTFSSAAVDSTYVVGLMQIEKGKDLLVRENWLKNNYPILTARSYEGEYGTGHNAYLEDKAGNIWNSYHARPGVDGPRSSGIRRVHFDVDGEPVLDLIEENDINPAFRNLSMKVRVSLI